MVTDTPPLLQVRHLSAGYGGAAVLHGINLNIRLGDWVGLLGANGSGKSTLLRALTGQIPLIDGHVVLDGIDLTANPLQAKSQFGYAVDGADLPGSLTANQYFEMVASIRRCTADAWPIPDLPADLGFAKWLHAPIAACSLGTRAKISIAACLLGTPKLIILDESLNGLDPVSSWRVKNLLRAMVAGRRHAVILSTHVLETVASSCGCAYLLHDGSIVRHWDSEALSAARADPTEFEAAVITALNTGLF